MIEAYIHGRKFTYAVKNIDKENDKLFTKLRSDWAAEIEMEQAAAALAERDSKGSPGMLPSPESIAGTSSANSTPTNRQDATPSNSAGSSHSRPMGGLGPNQQQHPMQHRNVERDMPPPHLLVSVNSVFLAARKSQSGGLNAAHYCMEHSQRFLTLPVMAKHYPRTFSRMVYSTYAATDEHEPDIEDEEGELFWPGQLVTGEGLGWVCTMGKAMIKEFGKTYHYIGLEGVIPKPDPVETPSGAGPPPPPSAPDSSSSSMPVQR